MVIGRYYNLLGIHGVVVEPIMVIANTKSIGDKRMSAYIKHYYRTMSGSRRFEFSRRVHRFKERWDEEEK